MNQVKQALKTWIEDQARAYDVLDGVEVVLNGETDDVVLPLIVIIDQGSTMVEQNGVRLYGVMEVSLTAELHTVPEESASHGTTYATSQEMSQALYEILGNDRPRVLNQGELLNKETLGKSLWPSKKIVKGSILNFNDSNVSGISKLNSNITFISSLNISGQTII